MKIRTKTIRRLLLIAATAGASAAVVGVAFTYRRAANDAEVANARVAGMSAFEAGDLAGAMPALTKYVAARPEDVDAIYALACAHFAVETPGRDNLFDARSRFQQVLARQPDHLPAKRQLLKIYERTHLPRELLALSDDVLKTVPGDIEATRCRAVALSELERDGDALPAWEAYLALVPTDFRAQSQLLATMKRLGRPAEQLVAHARANVEKAPDDPRFALPLAAALREAGKDAEAQSLLESIAAKPQTDALFVVELAAALDRVRSFDSAERLLARSAETLKSTTLSAALVERMWQNGRHAQVITATDGLLKTGRRDPSLLALRALSLWATDRHPEAIALADEIAAMPSSPEAAAWSGALAIEFGTVALSPTAQVRRLRESLDRDPDNGIFYAWLGRALRVTGEPEQAARCFREAAQHLPSWSTPCVELADTMLDAGRNADAAAAAKAAYLRAPSNLGVQRMVARVRFAELSKKATPAELAELRERVEALAPRLPADAALPAMRVSLLAAQGHREEGEAVVVDALASLPHGSNLLPLYDAARAAGLNATDRIFDRAIADGGVTPEFALSHASAIASESAGGTSAMTWMAAQLAAHPNDLAWALADVRVRQTLDVAHSAAAWNALLAQYPNERVVLSAALAEAGDLIDRPQQAKLIERLKSAAGEDASAYRIARARWLAASPDDAEARQALTIAADLVRSQPGRTDLRVLLARVLVRLDSAGTAVDHLRAAHDQSPADVSIALELADTLRRAGRWAEGVAVLKTQAGFTESDVSTRDALARALLEVGAFPEILDLFSRAAVRGAITPEEQLMRASAYEALGDKDDAAAANAAAIVPAASPAVVARVAAFERRQGHVEQAATLMDRVANCSAPLEERMRATALYALEFGEIENARASYTNALAKDDASADITLDAIEFEAGQKQFDAATTLAKRGAARFPQDGRINRAGLEIAARKAAYDTPGDTAALDALIKTLASDPAARRETAALAALRQSGDQKPTPELAARLVTLADAYPTSLELSQRAISASIAVHQPQAASAIARRLLASTATRVDAVALAAQTLLQVGDLPAARRAAERWRVMAAANPEFADVTLARIALAEGSAPRALQALEPYRATINWERDPLLPATLAEALAKSGRAGEAFELLDPPLPTQLLARTTWLRLVELTRDATGDAAATRLGHLELQTPADATEELVRLGGAFLDLAEACGTPRAVEHGMAILGPLDASGRLAGNGRALLAECQRIAGQSDKAQTTLRAALAAEPDNAMLKNSLAYLLVTVPGQAAEACRLADDAIAASPAIASFQDTRARAYVAANDPTKAELAFREAIRLDENCIDAWVGLARLQAKAGHRADAQKSVQRLDAVMAKAALHDAPVHLRAELRDVRDSVASVRD